MVRRYLVEGNDVSPSTTAWKEEEEAPVVRNGVASITICGTSSMPSLSREPEGMHRACAGVPTIPIAPQVLRHII